MPNTRPDGVTAPYKLLHSMLRVADLERSLGFYCGLLGMRLVRREDYPAGRFTLAFVGYGEGSERALIELTYNWDQAAYTHGTAFGHIALAVADVVASCRVLAAAGVTVLRAPGPMRVSSPDRAAPECIA
ncbi:MAG: VOC family protein, partial [Pseudomonadaceae bacterium]|nr:VOC family protein [Pseudomonadaceae bacterium]